MILCEGAEDIKVKYIEKLKSDIRKVKKVEELQEEIGWMLKDIQNYLHNENMNELTIQSELGMKYLFRGWVMKN